jgi:magnesium-protoporphyrin O-methyltransferase
MPDDRPCACGCANTFSTKDADADLERYRKEGPNPSTRALLDAIVAQGVDGATVLDIGAGIGGIQLGLLPAGAASVESVDATEAYVATAQAEADRRGYGDRTHGQVGNYVDLAADIGPADIVTLDKVLCCYSDMPALISNVGANARRVVGLVYPRETWWNRLGSRIFAVVGWVTRDPTRWHIHRTADVDAILRAAGFARREIKREFIWQVVLYVRSPERAG